MRTTTMLTTAPRTPETIKPSTLLDSLGITPKYVLNEYMKIVNQDDDLSNKLKALKPLIKELGIDIDGALPAGIVNNIIVMPAEIVAKYKLASPIIEGDIPTPQIKDIEGIFPTPPQKNKRKIPNADEKKK